MRCAINIFITMMCFVTAHKREVTFSEACVSHSVHGSGGGVCVQGECMCGGECAWQGVMHDMGCVAEGVHDRSVCVVGAYMAVGHACRRDDY